ncbi:MAG: SDR family NAD(P)-dependent oxidoreductase, partial [Hyphomicrobiales bacterium]|nr:SDR family NAD(P)-dependent oxidoreductase [Hyphomicrobiales bacterium]
MSESTRFKGRAAVVTGGASGIGLGVARRLATQGARVSLWDRDAAGLERAAAELGDTTHQVALDLTDPAAVENAARATADA